MLSMPDSTGTFSHRQEACLACRATAPPRALYSVRGFEIVRCSSCGLGRTLTPSDFDPASIYTQEYFQGGQSDGYADYQGSREYLSAEFRHVLLEIAADGATHGRLLEIGC